MIRRSFLWSAAALSATAAVPTLAAAKLPELEVFKSPYCGCCGAWIEHMKAAGFAVKVTPVTDTSATRRRLGLAERYASCHTATIGGYVLEGHIPAAEVKRLLAMNPKALGLAAPGMPAASPGMDTPGRRDPYDVLLVGTEGQSRVFATYPK